MQSAGPRLGFERRTWFAAKKRLLLVHPPTNGRDKGAGMAQHDATTMVFQTPFLNRWLKMVPVNSSHAICMPTQGQDLLEPSLWWTLGQPPKARVPVRSVTRNLSSSGERCIVNGDHLQNPRRRGGPWNDPKFDTVGKLGPVVFSCSPGTSSKHEWI